MKCGYLGYLGTLDVLDIVGTLDTIVILPDKNEIPTQYPSLLERRWWFSGASCEAMRSVGIAAARCPGRRSGMDVEEWCIHGYPCQCVSGTLLYGNRIQLCKCLHQHIQWWLIPLYWILQKQWPGNTCICMCLHTLEYMPHTHIHFIQLLKSTYLHETTLNKLKKRCAWFSSAWQSFSEMLWHAT